MEDVVQGAADEGWGAAWGGGPRPGSPFTDEPFYSGTALGGITVGSASQAV